METSIRKEVLKGNLEVSRVYAAEYQKEGTLTAELKQTVTTKSYYPTKSVANSHQDNIFGTSDYGFEEKEYENKENRVAWIPVPMDSTLESVRERLKLFPNACLYKVIGNHPTLTDSQQYAIKNGLTSKEIIAEDQVVRFPKGNDREGEISLDTNNKPQYRAIFFKTESCPDEDLRNADPKDFYITDALASELEVMGAVQDSLI